MKILLVANKYLMRNGYRRIDAPYWNFQLPFQKLGHTVRFYDIMLGEESPFQQVVEEFKPDLIFSILAFSGVMRFEPILEIQKITKDGNVKTFNWFCDDTWRFDTVSKYECWKFTACSTPEPNCVEKYKQIGYNNILLGTWHTNLDLSFDLPKIKDISFCGHLNSQRRTMFEALQREGYSVDVLYGLSQEDMMMSYSMSKIGINFSKNENDREKKTQMKLRMIEVPSSKSLLLTEYTPGIEEMFEIDKEIVTFTHEQELREKLKFLLKNQNITEKIALAGYKRFLKEHESSIRLRKILEEIEKI